MCTCHSVWRSEDNCGMWISFLTICILGTEFSLLGKVRRIISPGAGGSCEPPIWMLKTKLRSSVRVVHTLNYPAPCTSFLKMGLQAHPMFLFTTKNYVCTHVCICKCLWGQRCCISLELGLQVLVIKLSSLEGKYVLLTIKHLSSPSMILWQNSFPSQLDLTI